jgi:hypothetical protein
MEEFAKLRQGILNQQARLTAALARVAELEKENAALKAPVAARTRSKTPMQK